MFLPRVGVNVAALGTKGYAFIDPVVFDIRQLCSRQPRKCFGHGLQVVRCNGGGPGYDASARVPGVGSVKTIGSRLGINVELRPYRTVAPAADRILVIGDVHGDIVIVARTDDLSPGLWHEGAFQATLQPREHGNEEPLILELVLRVALEAAFRRCLRMANLVDVDDRWVGGNSVLVQLGDIFDRGDDDLLIEEWAHVLSQEARQVNGALYSIMGNHEVLNSKGDHSMATRKSFTPFDDLRSELDQMVGGDWGEVKDCPSWAKCRMLAMRPGGPVARLMASHAVCMKVGDTLFVHGGLTAGHLRSEGRVNEEGTQEETVASAEAAMEAINSKVSNWMLHGGYIPRIVWGEDSPVWIRTFSSPDTHDVQEDVRTELEEMLRLTGTKRMCVGHTPQRGGINSAADGQIWRLDTGMTAMIGGSPEVLEIRGDQMTVLTENGAVAGSRRACRPRTSRREIEEFPPQQ